MSLGGFDTLRDRHRDRLEEIKALEGFIERVVRRNPDARFEEVRLSDKTGIALADMELYLVELCVAGVLEARVFWNCPNGEGVAEEAASVSELPESVECDCGRLHYLTRADLEIGFIPSSGLRKSVRAGAQ